MDWEHQIGSDLCERDQDEGSFVESWMRDLESLFIDDLIRVDDEVEIEGSWSPPLFFGSVSAVLGFDGQECVKERARGEGGLDVDDAVEVGVLVDVSDWIGLDDG